MDIIYDKNKAKQLYDQIGSNIKSTEDQYYEKLNNPSEARKLYRIFSDNRGIKLLDAPDEDSFMDSLGFNKPMEVKPETKQEVNQDNPKFTLDANREAAFRDTVSIAKDSSIPVGNVSDIARVLPEKPAEQIINEHTPQQRLEAEGKQIGEDKIADSVLSDNLLSESDEKLAQWHKDNDAFITEYENRMNSIASNTDAHNLYSESFSPLQFLFKKNNKKDEEFINANSAKYDELIRQRDAIRLTKETAETMKQYADFDRSVAVGEQLSSYVDNGLLNESDMKELRNISDETERKEALTKMYNQGSISEDTFNKILDLGDTSDKSGLWYGMFKTGKIEDFATLGLTELARNVDILDIAKRYNNGLPINEEEKTLLGVYGKLMELQDRDRSFGFGAGMVMQSGAQFALESLLTGGVGASATNVLGKNVGKGLLKKLGANAIRQATLTPLTPMMYNDYAERMTGMYMTDSNVTADEKRKALWKSYIGTFSERFSETLGTIVGEQKLFNGLINNKFTRKHFAKAFETMAKIADNPAYKATADILKAGGVTDIPGEFASEYSGNIINSIFTLDVEPLAELFNPEFFGQVALQSVMMGGMGNVLSFTAGAGAAALENRKTNKEFKQGIDNSVNHKFDNESLESLKTELIDAISNNDFIGEDGTLESGQVSNLLAMIKAEYANSDVSQADKDAMIALDNAVRMSTYKYGQDQAIMAMVEDRVGEYLHDDGMVHEVSDTQGNNYFILAESEGAITAINKATREKKSFSKSMFPEESITKTNGSDWAINTFISNIDRWNQEDYVSSTSQDVFKPADKIDIDGVLFDVVDYNKDTNKYTVVDENGNRSEIDPNEEGVTPIYTESKPSAENTNTEDIQSNTADEETADLSEGNTQNTQEVDEGLKVDTEQGNQQSEDDIEYDETGDPVWSKISVERAKQEIDSVFEEDEAKALVADKIKEAEKAVKKASARKPKATNIKGRKAELEQIKAEKEASQANLDYWNSVAQLYAVQQPTQGEIFEQSQEDTPVVDDSRDNPADARARGFKMINGVRYDRQTELKTAKYGDNVETKFAKGITAKGKRAVIEAIEAQPSHIAGTRNPLHFTPEMQPKDRTDKVSIMRADEIARNVNPQEITGGVTAYTGSPSVNKVGEGIQGNNRLDALKRMYELYPEKAAEYKQYLVDHAAEWGLNPQDIASMNSPILVNVLDVTDEEAIQLGQKTAQDTESGGEQKISAPNVAQTLGKDMKTFAGILLRTEDEDIALDDVINANGYDALKWLTQKKAITETQLQTALDEKGNITTEARQSLKDILSQVIFQGGNNNIRQQFAMLPKAAQKGLLQTISRELDSAEGEGILKDIQEAIEVYSNLLNDKDFVEAKGKDAVQNAVNLWAKQIQMDFTEGSFVPEDRYSNFAIALAVSFRNNKMKEQAAMLNQLYDLLQAEGGDIFNPAVKLSKEEAVKQVYGVELNKEKQDETNVKSGDSISVSDSQESSDGRQGSAVNDRNVGQSEQDLGQTDSQGAVGDSQTRVSEEKRTRVTGPLSEEEYKEYQSKLDEIDAQIEKADTPNQALIDERSRLFYNFLRRITNESFSVVSELDFREIMEDYGISQEDIDYIAEKYHDPEIASSGIYAEGQIFFFTENIKSIEDLRLTLVHERQHRLTLENWNYYYNEVTSRVDSVDELKSNLVALSGINEYNNRTKDDMDELVGEFISYAMMYVYTGKKYPNRFKELGLNEKLINFIKEIDYEQRGYEGRVRINQGVRNQEWYSDLFRSRRGSAQEDIDDENITGAIKQNERDTPPGYSNVDEQGDRTSSTSGEGTQRAESSKQIEITEELIDSLPVDDLVKLYAKQYLNGKQNTVTRSAYQTIKDYVQNESRVGTGYSSNADTAQLGSRTDDAAVQSMGTDGEQSGPVDRGQSNGVVSTERPSGEGSQGSLFSVPGEESNNGVEQETSNDSDISSDNSRGSSRGRRKGSDVRKSGRSTSSSRVSADVGRGDSASQQSIDDKIKSADDLISDALAEIEDILKNSANTVGALGNAEMFKLIPATAKLGYALTKKGFYTFQKWFAQMQKHIGPLLQKHLTVEEVDEFIRDMWDTDFPFNGETHTVSEWASMVEQEELRKMVRMSLEEKIALQKSRENVETIVEDLDNIRESLPFLLPQQQEDVLKAETQFFSQSHKSRKYGNGKGIMFTNGTGTGKTYTGLGIVKRFVKQGKGRILIVTAQDKKIKDWIRDASNLGIEATQLKDTKDKGKGVVVTQFANMYQNRALLEEEWDLIVYDESHKLMESKDGRLTARAVMHHMLSNRDIEQAVRRHLRDHELFKKEYELRDELEYLNELYGKNLKELSQEDRDNFDKFGGIDGIKRRIDSINSELDTIKVQQDNLVKQTLKDENALEKAKKSVDNTKVVFLSASPFNTAKNLDYVESYIFSYNPEASNEFDGERLPSELREGDRNNFVLEKFPSSHFKLGNGSVQMRSEQQITNPEQSSQEEVDFSESLQDLGTLSGRTLDSEWDYSRQFPRFNFSQAETFNRMYDALQRGKYAPLMQYFKIFTEYNLYTEYFEAIKTSLSLDRIRQHVELGRKVVVFHRRRSNSTKGGFVGTPVNDSIAEAQIQEQDHRKLMEEFEIEFADYLAWEKEANLDFANYQITEAFATDEEKAQYQEDLKKWRKKVEEAKLKGTKKVPDRPTMKTKTVVTFNGSLNEKEKRENADAFNNPNSDAKVIVVQVASGKEGVDLHDTTGKFQRAEINLYLPESPIEFIQAEGRIYRIGNKSNAIFEYPLLGIDLELAAFAMKINGRAQTSENLALGKQSRGLRDSISRAALSSRPIPVSNQQGIGGKQLDSKQEQKKEDFDDAIRNYDEWRDKQSDILEDKQVPDPIGERMTVWAMPEGGDTVLVPFAGEGSVARYVDTKARLVAYEPSMAKYSRLAMLCGGSGRKIENKEYLGEERYYNDNILYFKPYGDPKVEVNGISHAIYRLSDSGRMIVLTTSGDMLRERLANKYSFDESIITRAQIKLPTSVMGINKNNLEIIVIDKLADKELQNQAKGDTLQLDFSNITNETELWEALRGVQMPERIIDNVAKTRKRAEKALDNYIASSPLVKKRTEYSANGKNKLVPKIYKSNFECSFEMKVEGYNAFRYANFTKGNPKYSPRNVEALARAWDSRQEAIKNLEKNTDKYSIERVEAYKTMCNFIEALLDKTPPQLRNLARGISENVVTGQIDVPTLKDTIKGMLGGNAALERLNDRVMKVAEAFGLEVEIVSENHPKFSGRSRGVQGFYSLNDNKIWIKEEYINSVRVSNERKAEVLLHEAIHAVTSHALAAYQNGLINENSPLYEACVDIVEVYEAIKEDPIFINAIKGNTGIDAANNEYGLTDVHEMMAELANPAFRAALKAKKLWRQVINGIKRILGIQIPGVESEQTDALNVLENALEVLLDNLDVNTFNRYKGAGLFSKMEFNKKSYEIANEKNSGTKGLAAVVVIKNNTTNSSKKTTKNLYRLADGPMGARQHSEDVMRESIDKIAQDLGVNAEYVSDEKQLDKKGWYDPKDGKVYVNLSAHETIADAKATYLHEVAGHFGLRGLLKEEFESTMEKVFNSLPENIQGELLNKYGDKTVAAEEYLSSMAENDIEPNLVEKVLGFIREALRSIGVIVDNYTNGDLEYLLWRSKNNLRNNAGYIEAAAWGAKDAQIRYRSIGRPKGWKSNNIEMDNKDKLLYAIQDRMRPVKKLMDEIIDRGGQIKESSDAYSQDFLTSSRAAAEIEDFKNTRYEPLAKAMADAVGVFVDKFGMTAEQARKAVDDYLYARHAPERNKHICVNEIVDKGMDSIPMDKRHLVNETFVDELRRMAGLLYDNQFRNGKNQISPNGLTAEQSKLAIITAGVMQKKTAAISKETGIDEATGQTVVTANNRSGMSDTEANEILSRYYTKDSKATLNEVSAKVKDCTNFTLEKWLEYGLISQEDFDTYQNQYEYYIPLRGWEEAEEIDYTSIPSSAFNMASEIINLNRQAKGRVDKAKDPLAYIASLAQSACISGNRNLVRQKAFNMVVENEALIADLAEIAVTYEIYDDNGNVIGTSKVKPSQKLFKQGRVRVIRDKDYLWHKTPSQLTALQVGVMIDGVRHVVTFKGGLGLGVATSINGTFNNTSNILAKRIAKVTRFISSNLTARNVYFLGKNMFRDLGFGNFAYFIENGTGKTLKLNKYYLSAMRTAAMDAMGADKSTYKDSSLYEEFKLNGGQTGYVQMDNIDNLSKKMNKLIDKATKNRGTISQGFDKSWELLLTTFDVMGKASENAMRFAVYKVERESGASPREAAIRAKEITVNFNRQGKTKVFSTVYAFFNPAVQGAYRYAKLALANPKRFVTATAALIAIKFGLGLICEALSGSDDDPKGENPYNRLSDYVKATNWVIPLGWMPGEGNDDKFMLIPLPQSVRASTHIADQALDVFTDRKNLGEAIRDFALFSVGEFIPFDIDAIDLASDNAIGTVLQAAMPTVARPFIENAINRDFMGNPIYKEPYTKAQDYLPQHQMAFKSTNPILVGTSEFLNELAGGSDNRTARIHISENGPVYDSWLGSFMDINPAKIEHVLSGYFGGLFKPVVDVYSTMVGVIDEDIETDIESTVLINQFIKGPSSKPGYKKFYEMRDEVELINAAKAANRKDGLSNDIIDSDQFNIEINELYKEASKEIKKLNEEIMQTNNKEELEELEKAKDAIILEAAMKYREICERRDKEIKK